jgi:hypothetical protein
MRYGLSLLPCAIRLARMKTRTIRAKLAFAIRVALPFLTLVLAG